MKPKFIPLRDGLVAASKTALLIIDMERDFIDQDAAQETPGGRLIIPAINRLISWARDHDLPVIVTLEMHRADHSDFGIELEFDTLHCLEGTKGCELTDGLDVRPQDWRVYNKRRYDCFMGTDLDLLLRSRGIKTLICCGVTAHVCVMNTVYTARNLDYRAIVAVDAVAGVSAAHYEAALLCMSDLFAYLRTTDTITGWPCKDGVFQTGSLVNAG
jgi:nicotinamidase-related amidase